MTQRKILVTGSSGTIGTRLCEKLLADGHSVRGFDLKPNKWNEEVNKLTIVGDLRDPESMEQLPTDFDAVIHLAANARVYNLVVDPRLARDNFLTVFNALEFARKNQIPRFMFSSSREVYGNSEKIDHVEDEGYIKNCESAYTASKIGGEALVHAYNQCYGIDFAILRFSNVYGMYDDSDRVIPTWIKLARNGEALTVFGGDKVLDFTYIDDTVSGIRKCLENFETAKNEVYNVAYGAGVPMTHVAKVIQALSGSEQELIMKDNRTGEVVKFTAVIQKAKEAFGYEPQVDVEEGIKRSIEWYANQPQFIK